jgi:glycerol-3-phosphate dehydrogenase (NAD(P)+)
MSRMRGLRKSMVCAVLGDGGWGSALAIHLHQLGYAVSLWGAFPDYVRRLDRTRQNPRYLPGVRIPRGIRITASLQEAIGRCAMVVLAVPSQHLRSVVSGFGPISFRRRIIVSVAKGIEQRSLLRMSQVIGQELGQVPLAVLSGPSIAAEVARGKPASLVAASANLRHARQVQQWFMNDQLRIYTSGDVAGVELGGALKNPIAIAAGVCDGLGLGANAKAALMTRGVVEMARLGQVLGARQSTFWGLSGLGDLVTTCLSGRNRWLGEQIGRGKKLRRVLASTPMVIEGVETARSALALARKRGVELPIIEQVEAILVHGRSPKQALQFLMNRKERPEF